MSYLLFFVFTFLLIGPNTSALAQEIIWEPTSLYGTRMSWRTLFVSSDGAVFAGANTGLRRSTDDGDSWEEVGPPGVNDMEELSSGTLVAVGREGVHSSTDRGQSWTQVRSEPFH